MKRHMVERAISFLKWLVTTYEVTSSNLSSSSTYLRAPTTMSRSPFSPASPKSAISSWFHGHLGKEYPCAAPPARFVERARLDLHAGGLESRRTCQGLPEECWVSRDHCSNNFGIKAEWGIMVSKCFCTGCGVGRQAGYLVYQ